MSGLELKNNVFLKGHEKYVSALSLDKKYERILVSGSNDGEIRLWDFNTMD